MELAENVHGKNLALMKPEIFDSKFGDSKYLLTDGAKSRIRGYLTTFGYMMLCGLLLLIGGGTFFIYQSVTMSQKVSIDEDVSPPSDRSRTVTDIGVSKERLHYAKEFQVVAFVFIGVGAVLFFIGAPMVAQFYARYKISKNSERSPILSTLNKSEHKPKIYTKPDATEKAPSSSKQFTKKKIPKIKRKPHSGWMGRTTRSLSKEGFRFAAHRHPSMNQISIDGSEFFSRRFRGISSTDSSDDGLSSIQASPRRVDTSRSKSFIGFIHRILSRTESAEKENFQGEKDGGIQNEIEDDISSEFKASTREGEKLSAEMLPESSSVLDDETVRRAGADGLYNLGE